MPIVSTNVSAACACSPVVEGVGVGDGVGLGEGAGAGVGGAWAMRQLSGAGSVCAMAPIDAGALNSDCPLSHFVTLRKTVP